MTSDTDTYGPNQLIILGISSWGEGQLEGEMERFGLFLKYKNFLFEEDKNKLWKFFLGKSFLRL